ncbi:MAG: anti-sigma factor [Nostocaceae cyanobacterium]|nr:anti-sigma factor [Nostocaceae cyanobacterium]
MERLKLPEDWEALLAGYVLGDLTPEDVVTVKQYLELYPELADEVNSLQATLALFPLSLPKSSPPPKLRSQILSVAKKELSTAPHSLHLPRNAPRRISTPRWHKRLPQGITFTWLGLAGGVAAVFIATLGLYNYQLQKQLAIAQADLSHYRQEIALSELQKELAQTRNELSRYQQTIDLLKQPNNRLLTLKGTTPNIASSGSLVIAPNSQVAVLTLQNLPPIPEDKVYRLWAFVGSKKIKCAKFTPDLEGRVMLQIPLKRWGTTTNVFVTIEPKEGLSLPTGETVMTGTSAI